MRAAAKAPPAGRMKALTTAKAARLVGLSSSTMLRALESKQLKSFRTPGGHYRVDPAEVERFRRDLMSEPPPKTEKDLQSRVHQLEGAVLWALGKQGEFRGRREGEGLFYWRTELQLRAGL